MTTTLLPLLAATIVVLAAAAFALYLWTYVRYVALADRESDGAGRCLGCPDRLAFA